MNAIGILKTSIISKDLLMQIKPTLSTLFLMSISFIGLSLSAAKGQNSMDKSGQSPKIAVVDISSLLNQDPQALKDEASISHEWRDLYTKHLEAMKKFEDEFTKLKNEYQTKMKELEALQKSGVSSEDMLQKRYNDEVAPLAYQLQSQPQQIQTFHTNEIRKFQATVGQKIQKVTDEVCKSLGWDFAVSKDVIVSNFTSNSRFDITQEVVAALNSAYSKDKAKAPAKSTK